MKVKDLVKELLKVNQELEFVIYAEDYDCSDLADSDYKSYCYFSLEDIQEKELVSIDPFFSEKEKKDSKKKYLVIV